jgi:threonine synthase
VKFLSTRGISAPLGFADVLVAGLARDGGLYVPATWPKLDPECRKAMAYPALAKKVMAPFVTDTFGAGDGFGKLVDSAYGTFGHQSVAPLVQIGPDLWVMELFHGPTLSFKDVAMQLLGRMFDSLLSARGQRATIIGATSGDTGSAAIEAFAGLSAVDVFILYPHGRVSEVQRRQMTTQPQANIHAIAVDGTFDDCQALVKSLFNDLAFRDEVHLAGVNSINWARIMPQTVYYVAACAALSAPKVHFSVPTGNFGDIYAGYAAKQMGASIGELIVATNVNDILVRTLITGRYQVGQVVPTDSPSMDIQVASNFERLLFDVLGRNGDDVRRRMDQLSQSGGFDLGADALARAQSDFSAKRIDQQMVRDEMKYVLDTCGMVIDPHTAVGIHAARQRQREGLTGPIVCLATAHPAKFPDAVTAVTGQHPDLPARMADLYQRPERITHLSNSAAAVAGFIRDHARIAKDH